MDYSIIKKAAAKRGISLKKLAESIGVTEQGFHSSIRNNTMTISNLEKICEVLKLTLVELLGADSSSKKDLEYKEKYISCLEEKDKLHTEIKDLTERLSLVKNNVGTTVKSKLKEQ